MYANGGGGAFIGHTAKSNAATQCLYDTEFNFSLPSTATVTSVYVTFTEYISVQNGKEPVVWSATLINQSGWPSGATLNTISVGNTSPKTYTLYNSAIPTWDLPLTPALINSATFGVSFQATPSYNGTNFQEDVYLTNPTVTVYYTNQ